ncbi:MAG: Crp/Fnr family transcriptional regulator [Eubacteriales bacterium]|nr:Crp/Fnr family transcriptional regulator [Eubacteriales bacterium]MDD3290149.1 Crp/Fnr family transcriptional regulator [Eubacteriales bacterium]
MENYMNVALQSTLLSSLGEETIRARMKEGRFTIRHYDKEQVVHFADEVCTKMEIILEGKVSVERIDEEGNLMVIAEFPQDEILGGNLLFSQNPRYPMTITAKADTVILNIEKEYLFDLFFDCPAFLRIYLAYISDHAVVLGDRIKHYVSRTIRESVIHFLEYESKCQGADCVTLPMTKKALAEKIGVQRTSLSRELDRMRKEGLIDFEGRTVCITGLKNRKR